MIFSKLAKTFSFISFSFVKRESNKVAHDLAHWLPLSYEVRLWVNDVPDAILFRIFDDVYAFIMVNGM